MNFKGLLKNLKSSELDYKFSNTNDKSHNQTVCTHSHFSSKPLCCEFLDHPAYKMVNFWHKKSHPEIFLLSLLPTEQKGL